ncbi:MAG: CHAT domain-containing protein [Planctomycetota bacterium]
MSRPSRPIALMVFADPLRDLDNLKRETSGLRSVFRNSSVFEVRILQHPSLAEIEDVFQLNRNQIVLFHYSGHADGFRQMMESEAGTTEVVRVSGFASFLASQRGLRFVFLNGCSTKLQKEAFFDAGVPAVLATTEDIDDQLAADFSLRFYRGLLSEADLQTAYDEAVSSINARDRDAPVQHRAIRIKNKTIGDPENDDKDHPSDWQLYAQEDTALNWSVNDVKSTHRIQRDGRRDVAMEELETLLKRVDEFWIDGVLKKNLDSRAIEVGRLARPDAINDPLEALVDYGHGNQSVLEANASLLDVFSDVDHRLLILGQPGSGKTTAMLQLVRLLVEQANRDPTQPVPVVVSLSAWQDSEQSIADWVEEQLRDVYRVPRRLSRQWIEELSLIYFFDGLDEVDSTIRNACVSAIHTFMSDVGAKGLVVCCRVAEYEQLDAQLSLGGAIHLQPLTLTQVSEFVDAGGETLAGLANAIERSDALKNLAQSPLMLNIMAEVYSGQKGEELGVALESEKECQNNLFERFIDRMFGRRRRTAPEFDRDETEKTVCWLAQRTSRENASLLFIENIQPSWLETQYQRLGFMALQSVAMAIILGITVGVFWFSASFLSKDFTRSAVNSGLLFWPSILFVGWFFAACLIDDWLPNVAGRGDRNHWNAMIQVAAKMVIYFLVWCLLIGLAWLPFGKSIESMLVHLLLTGGLGSMLLAASGIRQRTMLEIKPIEKIGWSSRPAIIGGLVGTLGGLSIWLVFYLMWNEQPNVHWFWQDVSGPSSGYSFFLVCMLVLGAIVGALLNGLTPATSKNKTEPNDGMRMSWENAWKIGSSLAVSIATVIFLLIIMQSFEGKVSELGEQRTMADCFVFSMGVGVSVLVCVGMLLGGHDWLKHVLLRRVLVATGQLPQRLIEFLEYVCQLNFLKRVGGGYIFLHRLLQEHFAERNRDNE